MEKVLGEKERFRFEMMFVTQEIPRAVQRGSGSLPVNKINPCYGYRV